MQVCRKPGSSSINFCTRMFLGNLHKDGKSMTKTILLMEFSLYYFLKVLIKCVIKSFGKTLVESSLVVDTQFLIFASLCFMRYKADFQIAYKGLDKLYKCQHRHQRGCRFAQLVFCKWRRFVYSPAHLERCLDGYQRCAEFKLFDTQQ